MVSVSDLHTITESVKPMDSIESVTSSSPVSASGTETVHGCFGKYKILFTYNDSTSCVITCVKRQGVSKMSTFP